MTKTFVLRSTPVLYCYLSTTVPLSSWHAQCQCAWAARGRGPGARTLKRVYYAIAVAPLLPLLRLGLNSAHLSAS
jgi:hypothetical protein